MKLLKSLIKFLIRPFKSVKISDVSILENITDFDDASDADDVEINEAIERGRKNAQKAT